MSNLNSEKFDNHKRIKIELDPIMKDKIPFTERTDYRSTERTQAPINSSRNYRYNMNTTQQTFYALNTTYGDMHNPVYVKKVNKFKYFLKSIQDVDKSLTDYLSKRVEEMRISDDTLKERYKTQVKQKQLNNSMRIPAKDSTIKTPFHHSENKEKTHTRYKIDQNPKIRFILRHRMPREHADECDKVFKYLRGVIDIKLKLRTNVEEHIRKVYDEFCFMDRDVPSFKMVTDRSFTLKMSEYFMPESAKIISEMLQIKKIFQVEEFVKIVNRVINWPVEKIFEFAYNVYNTNGMGSIDTNDLMNYLKSEYNGRNSNLIIHKDITSMLWFIENIKYKQEPGVNCPDDINIRKFREIKKMINKDYKDTTKFRDPDVIDRRVNHLFNKLETYIIETNDKQISFYDFVTQVNWKKLNYKDPYGIPQAFIEFLKIISGIDLTANFLNFKPKNIFNFKFDRWTILEKCYNQFLDCINDKPALHEKFLKENNVDIYDMDEYYTVNNYMRKLYDTFYSMADPDLNQLTVDSFKHYLKESTKFLNLDKIVEILISLMGEGYPINFFKYVHFHWKYRNTQVKLIFQVIDFGRDGNIGVYEIDYFHSVFQQCNYLAKDFIRLQNNMKELEIDYNLAYKYLNGESYVQNWIWLMFFGESCSTDYFYGNVKDIDFKRLNETYSDCFAQIYSY